MHQKQKNYVRALNAFYLKTPALWEIDYSWDGFQWICNSDRNQNIISFIQFWMWYGVTMIILVAGIMGISPTLFEAAAIDGATNFQSFKYVTLPSLRTIILYVLVTSFVGGMQMFDIPRLFNNGQPMNSTLTTSLFIFQQAFEGAQRFNRAAAASMIMFVLICIFSGILFFVMRDKDAVIQRRELKARERARRAVQ
jgi:multiple sugar transport system permease protein